MSRPVHQETLALARQFRDRGVVGLELSGNPYEGAWDPFVPAFTLARREGLFTTLHFAEAPDRACEVDAMLDFAPDRVGHGCYMSPAHERRLQDLRIPLELCLTSNIMTSSVPSAEAHHFRRWWGRGHPVALCGDDNGVFATTLSWEYALAHRAFGLDRAGLCALARGAVDHAFVSADEKRALAARFDPERLPALPST